MTLSTMPQNEAGLYALQMPCHHCFFGLDSTQNLNCHTPETFEALKVLFKRQAAADVIAHLLRNRGINKKISETVLEQFSRGAYHEEDDVVTIVRVAPADLPIQQRPSRGTKSRYQLKYFATTGISLTGPGLTTVYNAEMKGYYIRSIYLPFSHCFLPEYSGL
jgi:hypothetical protein